MATSIEARTANDAWKLAAEKLQESNATKSLEGLAEGTRELKHVFFTIKDPRQRWIVAREPAINPAAALADILSTLRGATNTAFHREGNNRSSRNTDNLLSRGTTIGYRLRRNLDFDQLELAYQTLSQYTTNREVVLQIWDARLDMQNPDKKPRVGEPAHNLVSILKVRDGKLEWTQIDRTDDFLRGIPYDFLQFTLIQELMAGWLGLELGCYYHFSESLVLREKDSQAIFPINQAIEISGEPNFDILSIAKLESDSILNELSSFLERISSDELSANDLEILVGRDNIPAAYQNLLMLIATEAARVRGWDDMIDEFMLSCTNPMLIQAWLRWFSHCKDTKKMDDNAASDFQIDI